MTLTFYNERKGGLIVELRDDATNEPLANGEFKITTTDGKNVDDNDGTTSTNGIYHSDANGQIKLLGLDPDSYVIRQTKAPDGYVLGTESQTVKVNANDTQTITFTNTAKQSITIQKFIDGTTKPLAGVTFLVTDASGAPVGSANGEHVTDTNGRIVINGLTPGTTLTAREVRTVKGYTLNGAPQTLVVGSGGTNAPAATLSSAAAGSATGNTFTFYDAPLSVLIVHSYIEGTDNHPLPGTAFKVTDGSGAAVGPDGGVYYADQNGDITLRDLEPGITLTVREVKTVDGYVLNGRPQQIQIESGDVQQLTFWNTPTQALTIQAFVEGSTTPIQGIRFLVTDHSGAPVGNTNGEHVTDENGRITLDHLEPGTVITAKEIRVADGYVENSEPKSITIQSGEEQILTFYNAPAGALVIELRDGSTGAALKGADFQVMTDSGAYVSNNGGKQSSNGIYTTDENGQIIITGLQPTALVIKETTAPDGYLPDTAPKTARVNANETQTITFKNYAKQTLTIQAYEAGTTTALPGIHFLVTDSTGAVVGSENGGFVTDQDGRIVINDLAPGLTITAKETESISGYVLNDKPQSILIKSGEAQALTFYNHRKGGLIVKKIDSVSGAALAGAEFRITTVSGELVADNEGKTSSNGIYKTDANGEIALLNLKPDSYTVTEIAAPAGYALDSTPQTTKVETNDTQTLTFKDVPLQSVTIQKLIAGTNKPLAGVSFQITDGSGASLGEYTTDSNGQITIGGLVPGSTIVAKETKTVKGYVLNEQPQYITVGTTSAGTPVNAAKANTTSAAATTAAATGSTAAAPAATPGTSGGTVVTSTSSATGASGSAGNQMTFYDEQTSALTIIKKDSASGKVLKGAQFQITYANGEFVAANGGETSSNGMYTTDSKGQINIKYLQPSTIVIRETKAPDGYILNDEPVTVELGTNDHQTIEITNDSKQTLTIQKFITGTTKPVQGAVFLVTDSSGEALGNANGEYTTDKNGRIVIEGLEPGTTITAKEIRAANGYLLDPTPQSIKIKEGEAQVLTFFNSKGTTLTIQKFVKGTTDPVQGATFLITDSEGTVIGPNNGEYTTDRNGRIVLEGLTAGVTITAKEIRAAEGYLLDSTPQSIKIREGEAQSLTFFNSKGTTLTIQKFITRFRASPS